MIFLQKIVLLAATIHGRTIEDRRNTAYFGRMAPFSGRERVVFPGKGLAWPVCRGFFPGTKALNSL